MGILDIIMLIFIGVVLIVSMGGLFYYNNKTDDD